MLKKLMVVLTMVMMVTAAEVKEVKAEDISQKTLETRARKEAAEYEYEIGDDLSEDEVMSRAVDYTVDYKELTDGGIYDIVIEFKIYKKYVYAYHIIYDAYEDYEELQYGVYNGRRYEIKDMDKMILDKFPEFNK